MYTPRLFLRLYIHRVDMTLGVPTWTNQPINQPIKIEVTGKDAAACKSYQTLPMYNGRFSKQIFLALLSSFVVQDPSSLRREQTISTASGQWVIRKIKYVHLKHLRSTGLYGAQLVHILTTLSPLCTIYQRAFYDSKSWYMH